MSFVSTGGVISRPWFAEAFALVSAVGLLYGGADGR